MTDEKVGSLEEEALKRKERLQALKRKNEESKENKTDMTETLPKYKSLVLTYILITLVDC